MPNVKIYLDHSLPEQVRLDIQATLAALGNVLCARLQVEMTACQFAIMPVYAMAGLPSVNVELAILPKPERTRKRLEDLAEEIQRLVGEAAGTHVAVRMVLLDPTTYIALK
ncbi:hypothetical protein [Rhizobium sullae]|uniref:5-carboxymethyl-2-hydroxymuconate isomerase n=1 Tax=Rhizobium sullae TaxID=50338 RepID=A0A4V2V7V6_RHISU|nr:hypothetical protein [Rhizobium sullae]TCU06066.1 hypothetical protein EV132_1339 [Rhizobium sullae]UWU19172.1 hypothetical protein N2599_35830 [Rhizobium sullae]